MKLIQQSKTYIKKSKKYIYKLLGHTPDRYPLRKGKVDFVFIHINKTAGVSITRAIGLPYNRQHLTAKEVIKIIGKEQWEKAYKFTIVRNPWDKVVSHYKYKIKINQANLKDNPISFSEWVKKTYGIHKDIVYYNNPRWFMPQIDWLLDDKEELNIDFVGRFENLTTDFQIIADKIGVDSELPHLNASSSIRPNYKEFYDEETKEIVQEFFQKDIEIFQYYF